MAFISINYDDGSEENDLGYKSVEVSYGDGLEKTKYFKSGDFVKDWYDANKFVITKIYDKERRFSYSSSVNHFIMDGAPFRSAYLKTNDTTAELVYKYDHQDRGIEFFVKKGTTPTWLELKTLCGDPSKKK